MFKNLLLREDIYTSELHCWKMARQKDRLIEQESETHWKKKY